MAGKAELEIIARVRDLVSGPTDKMQSRMVRFAKGVNTAFSKVTGSIFNLRNLIVGAVAGRAVKAFLDAGSAAETWRIQLQALVGDAGRAEALLQNMRQFAAESPLMTQDVIQSFVQLRAVGIKGAEDVVKKIGNVALIFNTEMQDVVGGFIGLQTRLLRRLGIQIERTGKTAVLQSGDIRKVVANDTDSIRQALLEIWGERFPNAMELAGQTFEAKMAVMKSAFFELFAEVGEFILPAVKKWVDNLTWFVNTHKDQWVAFIKAIPEFFAIMVPGVMKLLENGGAKIGDWLLATLSEFGGMIISIITGSIKTVNQFISDVAAAMFQPMYAAVLKLGVKIKQKMNDILRAMAREVNKVWYAVTGKLLIKIPPIDDKDIKRELAEIEDRFDATFDNAFQNANKNMVNIKETAQLHLRKIAKGGADLLESVGLGDMGSKFQAAIERQAREAADRQEFLRKKLAEARGAEEEDPRIAAERMLLSEMEELNIQHLERGSALWNQAMALQGEERKAFLERILALEKTAFDRRLGYAKSFMGIASSLATAAGNDQFESSKEFMLAETIISGIAAIQKARSSAPYPANIPAIAIESAALAANIAALKATNIGGGGAPALGGAGGGGGRGGGRGARTPEPEAPGGGGAGGEITVNLHLDRGGMMVLPDKASTERFLASAVREAMGLIKGAEAFGRA